jgi:hypothetical protein
MSEYAPILESDILESVFMVDGEWTVLGGFTPGAMKAADRLSDRIDHGNIVKVQVKRRTVITAKEVFDAIPELTSQSVP